MVSGHSVIGKYLGAMAFVYLIKYCHLGEFVYIILSSVHKSE